MVSALYGVHVLRDIIQELLEICESFLLNLLAVLIKDVSEAHFFLRAAANRFVAQRSPHPLFHRLLLQRSLVPSYFFAGADGRKQCSIYFACRIAFSA
jgi:hypothetical protein